jgi:hypothetical protein
VAIATLEDETFVAPLARLVKGLVDVFEGLNGVLRGDPDILGKAIESAGQELAALLKRMVDEHGAVVKEQVVADEGDGDLVEMARVELFAGEPLL